MHGLGGGAWLLGASLACTAPNPAYQADRVGKQDTGESRPRGLDAGAVRDTGGRPPDAGGGGTPDGVGARQPPAQSCGLDQPPIATVMGADSIAIDSEGFIYVNQTDMVQAWIDRLHPNGMRDMRWVMLPSVPTRGLAVDSARRVLYASAGMMPAGVQAIELDAVRPTARAIYTGFADINDLVVGLDGNVYVSEQGDGHIYSVTPAGVRSPVSDTPIVDRSKSQLVAGLAFDLDGGLMIGTQGLPTLVKLTLDAAGNETGRTFWGRVDDWANGLAVDQQRRVYVSIWNQDEAMPRRVVRLEGNGVTPMVMLSGGRYSGLAFGRGKLRCDDLYITQPYGALQRISTGVDGLARP